VIAMATKAVWVVPCDQYEGTWRYYTSWCFLFDSSIVGPLFIGALLAGIVAAQLWAASRQPKSAA